MNLWSMNTMAAAAVAGATLLAGCTSKLTGNEGNLSFEYEADDDVRDFNKPIAVGAKLELKVSPAGTELGSVELRSVSTNPAGVLRVASFSGNKIILEGVSSGETQVSVTARVSSGEVVPDSVNMMARVPQVLKMWHTCNEEVAEAHYLVNSDILVPFDMEMQNGQPVIGYGYHPVAVLPQGALALDATSTDQAAFHIRTAATPQDVTLKSTIDGKALAFRLVAERDVDGAMLEGATPSAAVVGQERSYHVLPTVTGHPLCQAKTPLTAVSRTPDICDASAVSASSSGEAKNEYGWVKVTGKRVGRCTFAVTFTNGKLGVTTPITVDVAEVGTP